MNITEQLYEIILKHNLDACNSRFRNYVKALKLISNLKTQYAENAKILLIGIDETDIDTFETVCDCPKWEITRYIATGLDLQGIKIENFSQYDGVLIVSFYWHLELAYELFLREVPFVDLYAYFLAHQLRLEYDFYKIFENRFFETNSSTETYDYKYYDASRHVFYLIKASEMFKDEVSSSVYLQKLILTLLYIKDFVTAETYIREYSNRKLVNSTGYAQAWKEIESLIQSIKEKLSNRKQRDLFMFWLDALDYSKGEALPFLASLTDKSMTFEYAHTIAPYTQATLKALFCAKNVLSDKSYQIKNIDLDNSPVLQILKQNDITFYYCGYLPYFPRQYTLFAHISSSQPASALYWDTMEKVLNSDTPVFCLMHELFGTHPPYQAIPLKTRRIYRDAAPSVFTEKYPQEQVNASLKATDRQVEYYSSLLSSDSIKIFMSDHGFGSELLFHTIFKVQGANIPPRKIDFLFNYLDFHHLINYIMNPKEELLSSFRCEFVPIQDFDMYYGALIACAIKNRALNYDYFGYRGLITKKICYSMNTCGIESFLPLQKMQGDNFVSIFQNALADCRLQIGIPVIDKTQDDKGKYSKYVYKIFDRCLNRSDSAEVRKNALIRALFSNDKCRFAIRGGGVTTMRLFLMLESRQLQNIHYVVDRNVDCYAGRLGLPVISADKVSADLVDKIVVLSYQLRTEFMKEVYPDGVSLVDLYAYLNENNVCCTKDFHKILLEESDYDVDFPFSDPECVL